MMHRHVAYRSALNMRLVVTSSSHLDMKTHIVQYPHCYLSHMVTLYLYSSSTRLSLMIVLSPASLSVSFSSSLILINSLIHLFILNLHLNLYLSYTSPNRWTDIHPQMTAMKGERILPLLCSARHFSLVRSAVDHVGVMIRWEVTAITWCHWCLILLRLSCWKWRDVTWLTS